MKFDSVGIKAIRDGIEALDVKAIADRKVAFNTLIGPMVLFITANQELDDVKPSL